MMKDVSVSARRWINVYPSGRDTGEPHNSMNSSILRRRMMCRLLLTLLLFAGALPIATWGQTSYSVLKGIYKEAVDQAIRDLNPRVPQHMNFLGYLSNTEKSNPFYIELHLKATTCKKTGETTHRDGCQFKQNTPRFNCAVCKPDANFKTHCVIERNAVQFVDHREKWCNKLHNPGEGTPIARKAEITAPECPGCF